MNVDERNPAPETPPDSPRLRVLVVDDNMDVAQSLASLLGTLGAGVRVVHDGPAALESVESYQPAAVVLDIGLPGMDGFEVARRIRRSPAGRGVTLVALTGWGAVESRARFLEAGFDHLLVKPGGIGALKAILADLQRK